MAIWHTRSKRKRTSGKFRANSKRKKAHIGGKFTETVLGENEVVKERIRGGDTKNKVRSGNTINVCNPDSGETEKVEIQDVLENPANSDFVRRDILTKGTIVDTEKGKVRITSRPGQEGVLNGVKVSEE